MQSIGQMSTQASHSMHSFAREHRLHVAVQAALRLLEGGGGVEAQFDLDADAGQRLLGRPRAPCSARRCETSLS
jgi:hypothetical protein